MKSYEKLRNKMVWCFEYASNYSSSKKWGKVRVQLEPDCIEAC